MTAKRQRAAPARIAVIGMGQWGQNLVRNFHDLKALACVCDSDTELRKTAGSLAPGVRFETDFQAVLADTAIPAVAIATPAATHYSIARRALEAGKDVFVEKPLSLTLAEGEDLLRLAAGRKRVLMVGHILQYHPAVQRLHELIRAGALGRIFYVYSNRLNIGKIRTEENILWSFAPHDVSVMLSLVGEEPSQITCQGGAYLRQDVPDVTMSQFLFPSGVRGHIHVSWLHPFKEQRLVVVGEEKMAVFDDTAREKLRIYPHKVAWRNRIPTAVKAEAEIVPVPDGEPLAAECTHFLECVRDRTTPRTDGAEGLRVLRVLSACQAALSGIPAASPIHSSDASSKRNYVSHPSAVVDAGAEIGPGTKVWHFAHVLKGARIGANCVIGQNVNVDGGAVLGNNVKVQNNVSVYAGVTVEDDVFLGPSCVLTNVTNPRSQISRRALYQPTLIRRGATVGANATILCGVTLGRYAFVGAGAVVTRDVPDYALMIGNPARRSGWMSRHGHRLKPPGPDGMMTCPESAFRYRETQPGILRCLDLDEDAPLPENQRIGHIRYDALKDNA